MSGQDVDFVCDGLLTGRVTKGWEEGELDFFDLEGGFRIFPKTSGTSFIRVSRGTLSIS